MWHRILTTWVIVNFVALTFWAIWPPRLLFTLVFGIALVIFYALLLHERNMIRRVLDNPKEGSP